MNPLKITSIFILILTFTGCLKTDYEQPIDYYSIGIYNPNQGIFTADLGTKFNVLNRVELNTTLNSDKPARILLYFQIDKILNDSVANINYTDYFDITVPLIHINEGNQDSLLRNDPIELLDTAWIAQDYLTFYFYFIRLDKSHHFFFSKNPEDQEDDKINLKFHHSAKGNQTFKRYNAYTSIPVADFKEIYPEKDSVEIVISVPNSATTSIEKSIWYKTK
jgi:hypothetical protein